MFMKPPALLLLRSNLTHHGFREIRHVMSGSARRHQVYRGAHSDSRSVEPTERAGLHGGDRRRASRCRPTRPDPTD